MGRGQDLQPGTSSRGPRKGHIQDGCPERVSGPSHEARPGSHGQLCGHGAWSLSAASLDLRLGVRGFSTLRRSRGGGVDGELTRRTSLDPALVPAGGLGAPGSGGRRRHARVWLSGSPRAGSFLSHLHPRHGQPFEGVSLPLKGLVLSRLLLASGFPGSAELSARLAVLPELTADPGLAGPRQGCSPRPPSLGRLLAVLPLRGFCGPRGTRFLGLSLRVPRSSWTLSPSSGAGRLLCARPLPRCATPPAAVTAFGQTRHLF